MVDADASLARAAAHSVRPPVEMAPTQPLIG